MMKAKAIRYFNFFQNEGLTTMKISKSISLTRNRLTQLMSLVLLTISVTSVAKDEIVRGPIIKGYGPVYAVTDRSVKLPENYTYKVAFDIAGSGSAPDQLNRRLESVARYINMHGINGVAMDKMDLAVVIHGQASKDLLSNKAYSDKFLFDNPNIEMLEKLRAAGVKFYICGQSLYFGGFEKKDLEHPEDLALSAMTMLTVLQGEGYRFVPK